MKKTILFLALCLVFGSDILAQNTGTMRTAGKAGGMGGRTFVYGEEVVAQAASRGGAKLQLPIEIDEKDARPLSEILDEKLAGTGISYRITAAHVLLFVPKEKPAAKQFTIYGYVIDAESKESLIGANVYVPRYFSGANTNVYGHFSVTVPEGETFIQTSFVGYKTDARTFLLNKDTLLTIALKPKRELAEVVVESVRPETGFASSRSGAATIPVLQILRTPAILGEADVIKALHLQPGVQSSSAGQVSMSVRGGNTDQNLFLLDGMLLYNVDHVMGFESAFMPDAVKHVDFYRGSFPARYGGRLSSVTDVRTKDGDMQTYHGTLSVGLLSSHLSLEGPIWKDRTSFLVSARRTYLDWLLNLGDLDGIDKLGLFFYDFNAKINHKFSDKDRLFLTFYSGRDVINILTKGDDTFEYNDDIWSGTRASYSDRYVNKTKMDIRWGNTLYHLRWNHIFSPKLFANVTVGYNRFQLSSTGGETSKRYSDDVLMNSTAFDIKFKSGIDDLSSTIDLDYHPNNNHHVRMGAQYTLHTFRPEVQSSNMQLFDKDAIDMNETFGSGGDPITAHEAAVYAEDDLNIGEKWQLNAGLRAALFATDGKTFPALEPRLSASRILPKGFRAKGSYTIMHQYVHKLQSSQIASPSDLWVPVTKDMKPMAAHQFSLGLAFAPRHEEDWLTETLNGWEFSTDIFYKKMNNVIDFIDGANFQGNSKGWESKISTGKGRSYGIEFNVNKTLGKTTGMLNYTLGKTDRWYPDGTINGGRHFPYRYDRRHVVHFLVQHQLTDRIDINASWNFMSGALASVAKQQSQFIEPDINEMAGGETTKTSVFEGEYISSRNNYRLEPTHQLDLGINFHRKTKHGERIWNISLINAYCHRNQDLLYSEVKTVVKNPQAPASSEYISSGNPGIEQKRVLKQSTLIPILPSFTYTYKF